MLAHDGENDPDILGMVAASAALTISGVPFLGPIAAARVGYMNGEFILNPTIEQTRKERPRSRRRRHPRCRDDGRVRGEGTTEETMLGAVVFGHASFSR